MSPTPLLPPPLRGWPAVLLADAAAQVMAEAAVPDPASVLARVRAGVLWWPVPRGKARRGRVLAIGTAATAAARAAFADADIVRAGDPADVDPEGLEAVFAPSRHPVLIWAAIGGLAVPGAPDPLTVLAAARGRCPWTDVALGLDAALDAHALLFAAVRRAGGRAGLVGMSPWKRRCLSPFLPSSDGPPRAAASVAEARRRGLVPVCWGAARDDAADGTTPIRVEDGFLRSVGLGLRHVPPLSLVLDRAPPHFDATRPNGFDACVAAATFTPALLARAERLAERIVALGLTKYNLAGRGSLPDAGRRPRILVAGQVENDASIRFGARAVRTNLALLRTARARFPDGFLLWRPHPDVLTGLRPGAVPEAEVARLADATGSEATTEACLAWADRVATITSLIGFEALLRGKAVTAFGRPFYAGWGLTDDADPPHRPRPLSRAELIAAALILYPAYVDPATGLPCPPEVVVEALARARAGGNRPAARLLRLWRNTVSAVLARL